MSTYFNVMGKGILAFLHLLNIISLQITDKTYIIYVFLYGLLGLSETSKCINNNTCYYLNYHEHNEYVK
jgi:hypothetical protein